MTNEQAKSELMQIYMSLSEEKKQALDVLMAIPSADSKTGHWIDTGSGQMCSRCGEIQYGYDSFRRFCASCGIRMVEPQAENKCNPNDCPHPYGTYETCIKCKEDCGARMVESQEISERNLKMWHDIYEEEKRREGSK